MRNSENSKALPAKQMQGPAQLRPAAPIQSTKVKQKKPEPRVLGELTYEEGQKLLFLWRHENFTEFNSWIQIARADLKIQIDEIVSDNPRTGKPVKTYNCSLILRFPDPHLESLKGYGFGRSKKDAKRDAIEKITMQLINNGNIRLGLRNKSFLYKARQLSYVPENMMYPHSKKSYQDHLAKRAHFTSKRMQEFIKEDNFKDASLSLIQILRAKKADWNEISFIWCYAITQQNLDVANTIIDLLTTRRILRREGEENSPSQAALTGQTQSGDTKGKIEEEKVADAAQQPPQANEPLPPLTILSGVDLEKAKLDEKLLKRYGFARQMPLTENPFETFDSLNADLNEVDIDKTAGNAQKEDIEGAVLADPFAREINGLFTADESPETRFGPAKKTNTATITFAQQTSRKAAGSLSAQGKGSLLGTKTDLLTPSAMREQGNYSVPYQLLCDMYEALLYSANLSFALNVAEAMYAKLKMHDEEFVNQNAALYCANKKNLLAIEFLESLFQVFGRERCGISENLTSLQGKVSKIGSRYAHQVLLFQPNEGQEAETKLLKFWQIEGRESFSQIAEGEFVLLVSSYTAEAGMQASEEQIYNTKTLAGQLNTHHRNSTSANIEIQHIFNSIIETGARLEHALFGCVREVTKESGVKIFVLPTKEQAGLFEGEAANTRTWKIVKLINRAAFDRLDNALTTFGGDGGMSPLLMQVLLSPPGQSNKSIQELSESKVTVDIKPYYINTNLNEYQQRALKAASSQLLTLIHGPPGCGKTTTSVEIVLEWLRQSPITILAIASTSTGLEQLHGEFVKAGIKAVKIGIARDGTDYNQRFIQLRKQISESQVICATIHTSTIEILNGMKFTRVLIDGASDINEVEALVAITRQCQQLVLLGDHKQIGPQSASTLVRSKGGCISLFERLARSGVKPVFLAVQHRMHPTLSMFPSHQFYGNNLQNGVDDAMRPIITGFPWPNPLVRAVFIQAKGTELNYGHSIVNLNEVEVVVQLTIQLLKAGGAKVGQIGIISPYDGQNQRIRSEILAQAQKFPNLFGLSIDDISNLNKYTQLIDVDTVDRFIGKEKDLVIVSTVRSNKSGQLGFLKDPRRLNTILTRARRGLILIGDIDTLTTDGNWRDWLMWAKANKSILALKQ